MSKHRTIPFGYHMVNGEITAKPDEVLAVLTIFSDYIAGLSLNQIAAKQEVPYYEGVKWNKNNVKRILENRKYLGEDGYPQLIDEAAYQSVQEKCRAKATSLCEISDELQAIRKLTFCKECGHRLFRSGGNHRSEKWGCHNTGCNRFLFRLTDQMLTNAILTVLNTVTANPVMLESDSGDPVYTPTPEIIRQEKEIHRMMDSPQIDGDRIKAEIYRLAQMRYDACTYSDSSQKTALIQSILADKGEMQILNIGIMKETVARITVSHACVIEVEFINGITIQNITERSETP